MGLDPLRVLIVGCGNIAGLFDQERSHYDFPYTHAGAYSQDERFTLAACVEPDDNRRSEFMAAWNVPVGYRTIDEVLDSENHFDVISICSPTEYHAQDLEISLRLKPKLIFCEKPITPSLMETERLVNKCRNNGILLAVNYSRRFDPDILRLQDAIRDERWGQLRSVVGIYNKGIMNNGSHMLDLLNMLVPPINIVTVGKPVYDFFPNDPTIPVWLEASNGVPVHIVCGHAVDYAIFELQLIFSLGVLTMEEGGMFWRERQAKDSITHKGYRVVDEGTHRAGEYPQVMLKAIDNIYGAIYHGKPLASTGESAISAQRTCELIKKKACE
jgi:predicted dehydrogenase